MKKKDYAAKQHELPEIKTYLVTYITINPPIDDIHQKPRHWQCRAMDVDHAKSLFDLYVKEFEHFDYQILEVSEQPATQKTYVVLYVNINAPGDSMSWTVQANSNDDAKSKFWGAHDNPELEIIGISEQQGQEALCLPYRVYYIPKKHLGNMNMHPKSWLVMATDEEDAKKVFREAVRPTDKISILSAVRLLPEPLDFNSDEEVDVPDAWDSYIIHWKFPAQDQQYQIRVQASSYSEAHYFANDVLPAYTEVIAVEHDTRPRLNAGDLVIRDARLQRAAMAFAQIILDDGDEGLRVFQRALTLATMHSMNMGAETSEPLARYATPANLYSYCRDTMLLFDFIAAGDNEGYHYADVLKDAKEYYVEDGSLFIIEEKEG